MEDRGWVGIIERVDIFFRSGAQYGIIDRSGNISIILDFGFIEVNKSFSKSNFCIFRRVPNFA